MLETLYHGLSEWRPVPERRVVLPPLREYIMSILDQSAPDLFIDRLSALSPLPQEARAALSAITGRAQQGRANSDILPVHPQANYACLIIAGLAGRFEQMGDGNRQITALHVVGDMVGLEALAMPDVYFPTQALSTVTVLCIPLAALRSVAADFPSVAQAFWAYSAVSAAVLAKWTANLGRKSAQGRMAHLLCEMGLRIEQGGQGNRLHYTLEATQTQLADALGLTSVHVNRTLRALKVAGLISCKGRVVHIHDWPRLAVLGDFCADYLQIKSEPIPGVTGRPESPAGGTMRTVSPMPGASLPS